MNLLLFNRFHTQLSKNYVSSPQVNFLRLTMLAVTDLFFQLIRQTFIAHLGQASLFGRILSKVLYQVHSILFT